MSTDKDRLGDKLHDREKAEEDRYFAQQDRAKLEKLRERSAKEEVKLGLCPRCGVALVERTIHDVTVDDCAQCGGVWLDKGELERIIEVEGEGGVQKFFRTLLK